MKKVLCAIGVALAMILLVCAGIIGYLTVDEYSPRPVETLEVEGEGHKTVPKDSTIRVMSWNLGYGALGDNADFFMDGGKMVYSADKERVLSNLNMDIEAIEKVSPDILMFQEMDTNSARSRFVNEPEYMAGHSNLEIFDGAFAFAYNFKVSFVPLPVPPIGKVNAGLGFFTDYEVTSAERLALPCPFTWPLSTMNLKRCLQEVRMPVEGTDKELVIINLHLEAYDDGEGKIAQTRELKEVINKEIEKGNYVVAGGDFNQIFSNADTSKFPMLDRKDAWIPGTIDVTEFGDEVSFLTDTNVPSCRSLDRPYDTAESKDPTDFQYYVIDGLIVSSNIEVEEIHTEDLGFVSSDHNPIVMDIKLK